MPLSPLPTPFPYTTLFRSPQWKQVHPGLYHREYGRAQVGRVRAHPSLPWSWREVGRPSFEGEVDVMKARAESRGVRQSARKMRLVIDQIRGRDVGEAYGLLQFSKKRAAEQVEKTLRSAVANAREKAEEAGEYIELDELYVKEAYVNQGPVLKRRRAAAEGRRGTAPARTAR